jgi:hypothetical protein
LIDKNATANNNSTPANSVAKKGLRSGKSKTVFPSTRSMSAIPATPSQVQPPVSPRAATMTSVQAIAESLVLNIPGASGPAGPDVLSGQTYHAHSMSDIASLTSSRVPTFEPAPSSYDLEDCVAGCGVDIECGMVENVGTSLGRCDSFNGMDLLDNSENTTCDDLTARSRSGSICRMDSMDSVYNDESNINNSIGMWNSRSIYDTGYVSGTTGSNGADGSADSNMPTRTVNWEKPALGFRGSMSVMSDLSKSVFRLKDDLFVIKFAPMRVLTTENMAHKEKENICAVTGINADEGETQDCNVSPMKSVDIYDECYEGVTRLDAKKAKLDHADDTKCTLSDFNAAMSQYDSSHTNSDDNGELEEAVTPGISIMNVDAEGEPAAAYGEEAGVDDDCMSKSSSGVAASVVSAVTASNAVASETDIASSTVMVVSGEATGPKKRGRKRTVSIQLSDAPAAVLPPAPSVIPAATANKRGRKKGSTNKTTPSPTHASSTVVVQAARAAATHHQRGRPPNCPVVDELADIGGAYIPNSCYAMLQNLVNTYNQDTSDPDSAVSNSLVDSRHTFLEMCQYKHFQFDSLRRAKHSSMMLLYYLHNPRSDSLKPMCSCCTMQIFEVRWHCELCPNLDFCANCYKDGMKDKHQTSTSISNVHEHVLTPFRVSFA